MSCDAGVKGESCAARTRRRLGVTSCGKLQTLLNREHDDVQHESKG